MWPPLTCVRVLMPCGAIAELGVDFFEVQVVGDFPEAEARLFLEKTLGASISDADWAEIFGVRVHACVRGPVPALLPIRFLSGMEGAAIPASPHVQVCGGNAGRLCTAVKHFRTFKSWTGGGCYLLCDHGLSLTKPDYHVEAS